MTAIRQTERHDSDTRDSVPRTAVLHWFAGSYLLVLGMSFLILPPGPINPLHGLVWLRGPFFVLSGLALLWLGTCDLSRQAALLGHVLAAIPVVAVGVQYVHLQQYGPAVTLLLLGMAVALSPLAPLRPPSSAWRPDAVGVVLGLALVAQGSDLLARPVPAVVPYGLQGTIAACFVVFGAGVFGSHVLVRMPVVVRYGSHLSAGAAVLALYIVLATGVASILWVLGAADLLVAAAFAGLPWLSPRLVAFPARTIRVRLAVGLFAGSLVPLLVAVPAMLALASSTEDERQIAFGATLLLSVAAAFAGWWLARLLTVPLSRLVRGVRLMADGVRPVSLASDVPLEIHELAAAVESMAGELDAQMQEIRDARDQHRAVAEKLQRSLQVTPGGFPGIELAHVYRSASQLAELGGDFYDVFHIAGDRIGILIGDVSGKGLDAAAHAVLVRASVRAFAYYSQSPGRALARANELLLDADDGRFVSAFLGILDPVTGELVCASAGHPPAVLIATSRPTFLSQGSPVLGVFDDAVFVETDLHLEAGDTLLLYTDGLTEARRDGTCYGESRLLAEAQVLAALPPSHLTEILYAQALQYAGGVLGDDLALLAVRLQSPETVGSVAGAIPLQAEVDLER